MSNKPKSSRSKLQKILNSLTIAAGVLLMAGAVGLLIAQADFSEKQSAGSVVAAMDELIPSRNRTFPEPHYGRNMPSAEIGGENFAGLLEVDPYGTRLPVGTDWAESALNRFPMAYSGSIYDRDLIIGGSSREGQFDFADEIEIGAPVRFIDLYGREFCFEVAMVNHTDDPGKIQSGEDDLTLFARSKRTSKYVIIRCRLSAM